MTIATSEIQVDWDLADTNPYAPVGFTVLNGDVKIENGGLKPTSSSGGVRKVIYTAAVFDPTKLLTAIVSPANDGNPWYDYSGPAL